MEEPIVRVENVSHRYNVQWAIRDINMEMPDSGIYGLLGSNGAGKSTLVKLLCGFFDPTDGCVLLNGEDIRKYNRKEYYRLFSAVFQDFLHHLPYGK